MNDFYPIFIEGLNSDVQIINLQEIQQLEQELAEELNEIENLELIEAPKQAVDNILKIAHQRADQN